MLVIGLGHKARHGKDWVAKHMVKHAAKRGLYGKTYSFADALKAYCRVTVGMREKDATLLQIVGTEVFRKYQPDIWVRVCMDTIQEQQPDVAIIPDMRFPNEVAAIQAAGGFTVDVRRRTADGGVYLATDRDPNHPSELALDNYEGFDGVIVAYSGDLKGLEGQAEAMFDRLMNTYVVNQQGARS